MSRPMSRSQLSPASTRAFMIVFCSKPLIRIVLRMELPSMSN